jgi:hypothetical protein
LFSDSFARAERVSSLAFRTVRAMGYHPKNFPKRCMRSAMDEQGRKRAIYQ